MQTGFKRSDRRTHVSMDTRMKNLFCNVCILCGTAVVVAITVKVILTLF